MTWAVLTILVCWTLILIAQSIRLWYVARELEAQRWELRRWKRVCALRDKARDKWN